jgi:hypothetical protein
LDGWRALDRREGPAALAANDRDRLKLLERDAHHEEPVIESICRELTIAPSYWSEGWEFELSTVQLRYHETGQRTVVPKRINRKRFWIVTVGTMGKMWEKWLN